MSDKNPLVSNISPPTELPSFILQQKPAKEEPKAVVVDGEKKAEGKRIDGSSKDVNGQKFVPAIPTNEPQAQNNEANPTADESELPSMQDIASALSPITEGVKNSVLFGWVKDTVKSGMKTGVQKAKESIDKVVTTLDPQMSQLIYSGGSTEIVVATLNDDKVEAVREAFQDVLGRATVYGHQSQSKSIAAQPVGFESAELAAKERINNLRSNEAFIDKVIVAVENFVVEIYKNQWFDVGLLLLSDPCRNISLKSFTQMTFIPLDVITGLQEGTTKDYDKRETGYAVTVGAAMSRKLDTPHYEWHKTYTTVDRIDMIIEAAKALASIYQLELKSKVPEPKVESN